jgi:phosphoribosylformylglycinamidine synthase
MAVGEALTNLAAADVGDIRKIKLSANWMAAAGHGAEDAALFDTVKAVGIDFCPALGVAIPVGKDSLSMRTKWADGATQKQVTAPLSLIVTAFAAVDDVRRTLTPQLRPDAEVGETELLLIDLGQGRNRLGGSALAQVYGVSGASRPTSIRRRSRPSSARSRRSTAPGSCWPTMTAPTAACSPRCAR